jgi:hypothetical protein
MSKLKNTRLVKQLVELGVSTTHQARALDESINKIKNIQQGRSAGELQDWQVKKLAKLVELLK